MYEEKNALCEQARIATPLERLKGRKKYLEQDLKKVVEAINVLEGNPELAKVVEALQITY